jgi:lipopolysaccharide cholinephosphotransferase
MKDILNVFQADWASTPAMKYENGFELKPENLKDKTILIAGHQLALCFAYTVLNLNDKLKLNANVVLAGTDNTVEAEINEEVLQREDFFYVDGLRANTVKQKVDYVIYTGLCGTKIDNTVDTFVRETYIQKAVLDLAKRKKVEKIIMLSDSRIYGKGANKFRAFSEMELGSADIENLPVQLMRTLESDFVRLTKEYAINSVILRTGIILGASSGVYNGLDPLFKAVADGKETTIHSTENKITFVYLSDVFNAVLYSIKCNLQGIYNVGGKSSTVSTGTLCAMLHDIYGKDVKVNTVDEGVFEGNELNCGKLEFAKFQTMIDLQTALELCVLSYKNQGDDIKFPHEHQGRLDAIQQILLGYLLEVDRICKKHNITYYLGGGTLLGAARHKGFIPWDDDVDIMLDRENYDKFLQVAPEELPEGVILQDPKKDKNSFYCYAKLRLTNTVFSTDFSKNHKDTENGFAFDIFCHDKTANSKLGQKIHSQLTLFWLAMVFNKWNHRKVDNGRKVQSVICNFLKNIFPLRFSMKMLLWTLEMFKHKKNAKYFYDGMGKSVGKGGFDKTFLDNEIRVDFEGYKLPVPAKYKEYLTNHYGDYMELAPLSTRLQGHEITLCDLGKYSTFKISNNN